MRKLIIVAAALTAFTASPALAGGSNFSIGFYSPAPVYYQPAPIYYAPPVAYYPPVHHVYYAPAPRVYYGHGHRGYRHHARHHGRHGYNVSRWNGPRGGYGGYRY